MELDARTNQIFQERLEKRTFRSRPHPAALSSGWKYCGCAIASANTMQLADIDLNGNPRRKRRCRFAPAPLPISSRCRDSDLADGLLKGHSCLLRKEATLPVSASAKGNARKNRNGPCQVYWNENRDKQTNKKGDRGRKEEIHGSRIVTSRSGSASKAEQEPQRLFITVDKPANRFV